MTIVYHQTSDPIPPEAVKKLTPEQWFAWLGGEAQVVPWTFGYTHDFVNNGMEQRTIAEHVLYFVTDGAFEVVFPDRSLQVTRGVFIWIMAGVTHETRALAGVPFRDHYFRLKFCSPDGGLFRLESDCVLKEQAWVALPYIKQLADEMQSEHLYHSVRIRALLQLLTSWAIAPDATAAHDQRSL